MPEDLFQHIEAFEWDEEKRAANKVKHGIDLERMLDRALVVERSDRGHERRYFILGIVNREVIAVACTLRGDRC